MKPEWGQFFMTQRGQFRMAFDRHQSSSWGMTIELRATLSAASTDCRSPDYSSSPEQSPPRRLLHIFRELVPPCFPTGHRSGFRWARALPEPE